MEVEIPVPSAPTPRYSPARFAPPALTTAAFDPMQSQLVADDAATGQAAPIAAQADPEAEDKLSAEIVALWADHKSGKAAARRTRGEIKCLRLALAGKLHTMKAILVRTGRGGGWASYLRSQKLAPTTADRYVAEHEATLTPPTKKGPTGVISDPTEDELHRFAEKLLPRLRRMLNTPQSVVWFVEDVIMQLSAADGRRTKAGFEVLMPVPEGDVTNLQLRSTPPTPPLSKSALRPSLTGLYSQPRYSIRSLATSPR